MQTFIPHSSCFSNVCERQSLLHNTFRELRGGWFWNCIWLHARLRFTDLRFEGRVCFDSLIKIFVLVHRSTLSFSCICSVLNHTAPTVDILLFIHFYISLCEVLFIHIPCLLHDYTYLILFLSLFFIYEFSFLIMILIVSMIYVMC